MPIVESSEYEYSREEEERQFLRSLESPGLEMSSMQPSRPAAGKTGVQKVKRATTGAELSSIGDEQPPAAFGSKFVRDHHNIYHFTIILEWEPLESSHF
jgi:hypothetical protein